MRGGAGAGPAGEGGFTLVELLVVISILGVISFALTEAVIVGLKTTDGVTADVTRTVAVQALRATFTDDVQRADLVSDPDPAPTGCSPSSEVFLRLTWTDDGASREVAYSLEPDGPAVVGERQLVRWSCTAASTPDKRMLGLFEFAPPGPPVAALCPSPGPGLSPCAATPTNPATVTLRILTNRPKDPPAPIDLTVRRRMA